jgi:uncharacterized membrane protein
MADETMATGVQSQAARPVVRRITLGDIGDAVARGLDDFSECPTHLIILGLIYPVLGLVFGRIASSYEALPLLYPLVAGFALVGPLAGIGWEELSRRREQGAAVSWINAFGVFSSPRFGAIAVLGLMLVGIFVVWLRAAVAIYDAIMPPGSDSSLWMLIQTAFTTRPGWLLIVVGTGVGFIFALIVLTVGVVTFPLLLDRQVGETTAEQCSIAVQTSMRAVLQNPVPMAAWGLFVAAALVVGSIPLLVGLAVVMPILGHATWHLYRKVVG